MAVDIGAEAIDRLYSIVRRNTYINQDHPATVAGIITSIDIWAVNDITLLKVATFYLTGTNKLKCRASQAIAGTITAGSKVTKAVSIAVEIGDYIGCYFDNGDIELDGAGFAGVWTHTTDNTNPEDEETYTVRADDAISLGGYIGVAGWTGEIAGVINPASIMGVDVENIEDVKGVVSG